MTFEDFEVDAWRTFGGAADSPRDQLIITALGLAGESGEYVDLIKKAMYHGHPLSCEAAQRELGDVLYYLAVACRVLGTSLEEIAITNSAKLRARYPDGFETARSIHRETRGEA